LAAVEYLGVICVFVVLSRGLSPYYVTNLLDPELPFTGIIEASNVVDPAELDGKHLVYLPKYVPKDDSAKKLSDDEIVARFVSGLKKVHPDLKDAEILHTAVFREDYVQPLQDLGYLERSGGMETPIEGVYVCNTSMIENSTLNNNAAITLGRTAAGVMTEKTRVAG
jgi:protoporphyrinogen oxidase